MTEGNPPNVLFLVWDAARVDYITEHAPFLKSLKEDNLWFKNAYAPSTWSLPSHPSLFNGQLPSEHGCYRVAEQRMDDLPLVKLFNDQGYSTYGVSGNGFANQRTGFDTTFDDFAYTADWGPSRKGLNVSEFAYVLRSQNDEITSKDIAKAALVEAISHEYPLRSLVNFGAVFLNRLAARIEFLQNLPHPLFDGNSQYSYSLARNTAEIKSFVSETAEPFFLFANYMDTHRPYNPPSEFRDEQFSDPPSYTQTAKLNRIAAPWEFIKRTERGEALDAEIEQIRSLYTGEVATADRHLRKVVSFLKENDLYENTIIVVTSDHGENLGETDLLGNKRMGHEASISEQLIRVPLLIAHPNIESRSVSTPVSNRRVFDFLKGVLETGKPDAEVAVESVVDEAPVCIEYPATGGEAIFERYPDVSRESLGLRTSVHHSVAVDSEWTMIADSSGQRLAFEEGTKRQYETAPESLRNACEENLERLKENGATEPNLSDEEISQLEALGYI